MQRNKISSYKFRCSSCATFFKSQMACSKHETSHFNNLLKMQNVEKGVNLTQQSAVLAPNLLDLPVVPSSTSFSESQSNLEIKITGGGTGTGSSTDYSNFKKFTCKHCSKQFDWEVTMHLHQDKCTKKPKFTDAAGNNGTRTRTRTQRLELEPRLVDDSELLSNQSCPNDFEIIDIADSDLELPQQQQSSKNFKIDKNTTRDNIDGAKCSKIPRAPHRSETTSKRRVGSTRKPLKKRNSSSRIRHVKKAKFPVSVTMQMKNQNRSYGEDDDTDEDQSSSGFQIPSQSYYSRQYFAERNELIEHAIKYEGTTLYFCKYCRCVFDDLSYHMKHERKCAEIRKSDTD